MRANRLVWLCALGLLGCKQPLSEEAAKQKLVAAGLVDIELTRTESGFDYKAATYVPRVMKCTGSVGGSGRDVTSLTKTCTP